MANGWFLWLFAFAGGQKLVARSCFSSFGEVCSRVTPRTQKRTLGPRTLRTGSWRRRAAERGLWKSNAVADGDTVHAHHYLFDQQTQDFLAVEHLQILSAQSQPVTKLLEGVHQVQIP